MTAEADDLDRASELSQRMTESSILRVQKLIKVEQVQNADGTWPVCECVGCGDDIPPLRLALAKIRCVECQTRLERGQR